MVFSKKKFGFGLLAILLAVLALISFCVLFEGKVEDLLFIFLTENGPFSLDEASDNVSLPLYSLNRDPNTKSTDIDTVYYFFDYGAEKILDTYFVFKTPHGMKRVALMKTYHNLSVSVNILRAEQIPIAWAYRGIGQPCEIPSFVYEKERISGDAFQSCLAWLADGNQYIFYSVWTEDEAIKFVNSLIEIKKKDSE